MSWSKCPVCYGRGLVSPGFYDLNPIAGNSSTVPPPPEKCRACNNGIIYDFNPQNILPIMPQEDHTHAP